MEKHIKFERNPKIRVLIINSYKIIQQSLQVLLEDTRDLIVVGMQSVHDDLHNNLTDIDVAVIYLTINSREEVNYIKKLLTVAPLLRVVVATNDNDFDNQTKSIQLGAVGIVIKEKNSRNLIEAIRQTFRGETWINQTLLTRIMSGINPSKANDQLLSSLQTESLTSREHQVISLIGQGLKNKEIAQRLKISEATVRHHLSSIYSKLGVNDRLNLVIYAYQHDLIKIDDGSANEKVQVNLTAEQLYK